MNHDSTARGLAPLMLATLLGVATTGRAHADPRWAFEAFLGGAFNFSTPLTIRQSGFPDLEFDATYETRPFEFPIYYALRVARWNVDRAWAVELVHHKLHLKDAPAEIQEFAISHGYNLLTLDRLWRRGDFVLGVGAGAVIGRPENTIRGLSLSQTGGVFRSGYHVSGATAAVFAGRPIALARAWDASLEVKVSGSTAQVPVRDGEADVPALALHMLVGIGFRP